MHNPTVPMSAVASCEFTVAFAAEIGTKAVVPPDLRVECKGKEELRPLRHGPRTLCKLHMEHLDESIRRKHDGEIQLGPSVDSPKNPQRILPTRWPAASGAAQS
jgi:hypothetical protein